MKYKEYYLVVAITIISSALNACSANDESVGGRQPATAASSLGSKATMEKELQSKMTVVTQCLTISDKVSILLERRAENSCISQFSSFNNSACSGKPVDSASADQNSKTRFDETKKAFAGLNIIVDPLDDVNHCGELRILRRAGNCRQWEYLSGGDGYLLCTYRYEDGIFGEVVPGRNCISPYISPC